MARKFLFFLTFISAALSADAQEWVRVHRHYADAPWTVPMRIEQARQFDISADGSIMTASILGDGSAIEVPLSVEAIDSITFANSLTDDEKGHDKYRVFTLHIATADLMPILEKKEWVDCYLSLDGKGEYSDYSGTARIRGRGNSTWEWYDKKPYKIKLDSKSKLLGLDKAKDWNLLANYRDPTDLMNAFAFEAARCMGMPHTNHTRFVEVFLNEQYIGLYQLTEKIEVDPSRVDIDKEGGVLLSFDQDDGPDLDPLSTSNFYSKVFRLPMCVKHPDSPTADEIEAIRADFAVLESAVKARDYAAVAELMDVESFIHILQMHEFLYNVEIDAPRSLYMYRDKGGKYTFGPVWDWDAGFDFDWGSMKTGHNFFNNHTKLIYGYQPATYIGAQYRISEFWTTMFHDETFVRQYKDLWAAVSDTILTHSWGEMEKYLAHLNDGAFTRDCNRWPITRTGGKHDPLTPMDEAVRMKQWLTDRLDLLNETIANYPDGSTRPDDDTEYAFDKDRGEIRITKKVVAAYGYNQIGTIDVSEDDVVAYLGGAPSSLLPLNADGTVGTNTAAGTYGAWFNANGDTDSWHRGHVYIESHDLYSWAFGSHPDNCYAGHAHTVMMQYKRGKKTMKVVVRFEVK